MAGGSAAAATRVLGLTGPIGCGKTTVGDILLRLGARQRIDADRVVHGLMAVGGAVVEPVTAAFGPEVRAADGSIDRARLAARVFGRPAELARLEAIVHPAVRAAVREELAAQQGGGVVVVDAVKLLESDLLPLVEQVWVIQCAPEEQRRRLLELRGMTVEDAESRLRAQPSFEHPRVDVVIHNSGSADDLEAQVRVAWEGFLARSSRA